MFTGIIEAVGQVESTQTPQGDMRLTIKGGNLNMQDVSLGDSIAVNGVCLTVIEFDHSHFVADVSNETIKLTSLQNLSPATEVNLEKALLPTTRLGGHLVSGHVDGLAEIVNIKQDSRSIVFSIKPPEALKRYIAPKGSICIDGTSLTVNIVTDEHFEINIVPHTQQKTIIKNYIVGTKVNLEVDLIARYLEQLLLKQSPTPKSNISLETLANAGFSA